MTKAEMEEQQRRLIDERRQLDQKYAEDLQRLQTGLVGKDLRAKDESIKEQEQAQARAIIEKEKALRTMQKEEPAIVETRTLQERLEVALAKICALEQFSSDLQIRFDKVEARCIDKETQLHELMNQDLPMKLVESKR
jgi:hypothetical protein